jgi:hypothetical protein
MTYEHTPECREIQAQQIAHMAAYTAQWPNFCRECFGTGNIFDNADDEGDFCGECIYADLCPRCRADFCYEGSHSRCPACGWESLSDEDDNNYPVACDCYRNVSAPPAAKESS